MRKSARTLRAGATDGQVWSAYWVMRGRRLHARRRAAGSARMDAAPFRRRSGLFRPFKRPARRMGVRHGDGSGTGYCPVAGMGVSRDDGGRRLHARRRERPPHVHEAAFKAPPHPPGMPVYRHNCRPQHPVDEQRRQMTTTLDDIVIIYRFARCGNIQHSLWMLDYIEAAAKKHTAIITQSQSTCKPIALKFTLQDLACWPLILHIVIRRDILQAAWRISQIHDNTPRHQLRFKAASEYVHQPPSVAAHELGAFPSMPEDMPADADLARPRSPSNRQFPTIPTYNQSQAVLANRRAPRA